MKISFWLALALLDLIRRCRRYIFTAGIDYHGEGNILVTPSRCVRTILRSPVHWPHAILEVPYASCQAVVRRFRAAKICGRTLTYTYIRTKLLRKTALSKNKMIDSTNVGGQESTRLLTCLTSELSLSNSSSA